MSKVATSGDAPAKKRGKLPLIIGLVVLLAGGGGGYFWWSSQRGAKAAEAGHWVTTTKAASGDAGEHAGDKESHDGGDTTSEGHGALLPLDSFTVNLADPEASRFLRTDVQLVLADEEVVKELEHEKVPVVRARAAVLELLSEQTSHTINTPDGKAALKKAIAERAGKVLHQKVSDVLFSDFVIQF